jgi:UDP-glucose 4-epimerase
MKVLVTGGAGFIGSHLCEILLARGCNVSVIDDLSTGRYENIEHLEKDGNFELIIDTILNKSLVEALVKSADIVFHLASAVGVRLILEQPVKTIETIVEGTTVVLSQARRYRRGVVITSTSEVYGKGSKVPFAEQDDTILGPTTTRRWAYAAAKTIDEFLCLAHWYETRLPVICARLFNTVGPRQTGHYGMVIPRFVDQALQGKDIIVYSDGEQTRSFCHVKDVAVALVNLSSCPAAYGNVVNIGNNQEITINCLAARVKELSGSSSNIVHIPYETAYEEGFEDMRRRVPDLTLARKLIDFRPKHALDDILLAVIEEHRKELARSNAKKNAYLDQTDHRNLSGSNVRSDSFHGV